MYLISIHVPTRGTTRFPRYSISISHFNPRAHEGHDALADSSGDRTAISIHVPTRGTTAAKHAHVIGCVISIHVPTRGTTRYFCLRAFSAHFNPRAHEGHDCPFIPQPDVILFQSTCPRGARRVTLAFHFVRCHFNPRAHEGHDSKILRSKR